MNPNDMRLVYIPDPILFTRCQEVDVSTVNPIVAQCLLKMLEIMQANKGIGLAANQANLPYRMFVMQTPDMKKPMFFINPKIIHGCIKQKGNEGCLSCPGYLVSKIRDTYILLEYNDPMGNVYKQHFKDLQARCIQHEIDHLDGICIAKEPIDMNKFLEVVK